MLLKSDGFPTYHLANVVDDRLMEISHVIRAEEWISSTPKHILLYRAFGWPPPVFIHMPLLRNKDKSKISKRKNPTSLLWYRQQGYLPEALLNFLALMGWHMSDEREVFSLDEMVREFAWERVATSGPVFDLQKLDWLNGRLHPEAPARRTHAAHPRVGPEGGRAGRRGGARHDPDRAGADEEAQRLGPAHAVPLRRRGESFAGGPRPEKVHAAGRPKMPRKRPRRRSGPNPAGTPRRSKRVAARSRPSSA